MRKEIEKLPLLIGAAIQTVDKARFNKGKRAISMSRREKYEATRPRAS